MAMSLLLLASEFTKQIIQLITSKLLKRATIASYATSTQDKYESNTREVEGCIPNRASEKSITTNDN